MSKNLEGKAYTYFHPDTKKYETVEELYEAIYPDLLMRRTPTPEDLNANEIYISMPITSAGEKRKYRNHPDINAVMDEIISNNKRFARFLTNQLHHMLDTKYVTVPANLHAFEGWKEVDFMRWWMIYITGLKPTDAKQYIALAKKEQQVEHFNNYASPKAQRAAEYKRETDLFLDFIRQNKVEYKPVAGIVCMPDYDQSLGCGVEVYLGQQLDIPVQEVIINKNHTKFKQTIFKHGANWIPETQSHRPLRLPAKLSLQPVTQQTLFAA